MSRRAREETLMRRYLLNELSSVQRDQVEQRFFQDPEYFDELATLEEELVDDYARGGLSPEERQRFEKEWIISPERRERVDAAKALFGILREESRSTRPGMVAAVPVRKARVAGFQWALAAATFIMALGALWLVPERSRLRDDLRDARERQTRLERSTEELRRRLESERMRNSELNELLRRERASSSSLQQGVEARTPEPGVVALVLPTGVTRSGADQRPLIVPAGATLVRLQVDIPGDRHSGRLHAVLRTPETTNIWSQDVVLPERAAARTARLSVPIPSPVLPDGDYILTVQTYLPNGDREDLTSRAFRVVRR